jgi:hypothetical protein
MIFYNLVLSIIQIFRSLMARISKLKPRHSGGFGKSKLVKLTSDRLCLVVSKLPVRQLTLIRAQVLLQKVS